MNVCKLCSPGAWIYIVICFPFILVPFLLFLILAPFIGIISTIIFAIKQIVIKKNINREYIASQDKNGFVIPVSVYISKNSIFNAEQKELLKHERNRVKLVDKYESNTKILNQSLRCIIPIVGLAWILYIELSNNQNSIFNEEKGNPDDWTPIDALNYHLG
jgi:hypothetical protein